MFLYDIRLRATMWVGWQGEWGRDCGAEVKFNGHLHTCKVFYCALHVNCCKGARLHIYTVTHIGKLAYVNNNVCLYVHRFVFAIQSSAIHSFVRTSPNHCKYSQIKRRIQPSVSIRIQPVQCIHIYVLYMECTHTPDFLEQIPCIIAYENIWCVRFHPIRSFTKLY